MLYDANGNQTGNGNNHLVWDAFDRLKEVWDSSGTVQAVTYIRDAQGRLLMKDFTAGSSTSDTLFSYDGWRVLQEEKRHAGSTGSFALDRQFAYGPYLDEPIVMDVNANGDGDCLDLTAYSASGDHRYLYHHNNIYSVYGLTSESANLVEAYEYDPYGKHMTLDDGPDGDSIVNFGSDDSRTTQGISSIGNPYGFTGRDFDPETCMLNYRIRYDNVDLGRFVSRDDTFAGNPAQMEPLALLADDFDMPRGYLDGPHLYQYVRSNPTHYTDPYGRRATTCDKCGPEIGSELRGALGRLDALYNSWNWTKQKYRCANLVNPIVGLDYWDLFYLKNLGDQGTIPYSDCASGRCAGSVKVNGTCYDAYAVNYAAWGRMAKLCNWPLQETLGFVEQRPEPKQHKKYWTIYGYDGRTPPADDRFAKCGLKCNQPPIGQFLGHWDTNCTRSVEGKGGIMTRNHPTITESASLGHFFRFASSVICTQLLPRGVARR